MQPLDCSTVDAARLARTAQPCERRFTRLNALVSIVSGLGLAGVYHSVYVCTYLLYVCQCKYVCIYPSIHPFIHPCVHTYAHEGIKIFQCFLTTHIYIYIYTHIHLNMNVRMYLYALDLVSFSCLFICIQLFLYLYDYTCSVAHIKYFTLTVPDPGTHLTSLSCSACICLDEVGSQEQKSTSLPIPR